MSDFTEVSTANATRTSALGLSNGSVIPRSKDSESHASASLVSGNKDEDTLPTFPFLNLPAELRVRIYRYLLHAPENTISVKEGSSWPGWEILRLVRSHLIATDPSRFGDLGTYRVCSRNIRPAILSLDRQTYSEARQVFYSENCFFFPHHSLIISFLKDRPQVSRSLIKKIRLPLHFPDDLSDSAGGMFLKAACTYMRQNLELKQLTMGISCASTFSDLRRPCPQSYLDAIHEKSWVQYLVPFVGTLDTCELVADRKCGDGLILAVQKFLESKNPQTSKTTIRTRTY
ncbi:hypothetical protein HO173_012349 [Letharia columbiana]|uniref:F-box domain-containing protein n=1 Tax=Letharia columbiana TaxID=112416 RepID=A0A8H6FG04_9LECA|nr:uncharacterized protein HO173_012349 [Letharia columbiana]KAF6226746.1 hypothetical protein HO173_012349 [Letharia columbiana]